jgi:hypothetical protein
VRMLVRRPLLKILALLSLLGSIAATGAASSVAAPSECTPASSDPVCEYLANEKQAEPTSSSSSVSPGAIEPLPVNPVIQAEFNAHISERKNRGLLAVGVQGAEVRLSPGLEGGWVGWCMSVRIGAYGSARCGVAPNAHEQIGYEHWEAGGSATRGVALLNAPLEAVAVDDANAAFAGQATGVPAVTAALVEIAAPFPAQSHWFDEFEPVFGAVRSSGSRGLAAPEHAFTASVPALAWSAPQAAPSGVCAITPSRLPGLRARSGHVATSVTPTPGLSGAGFASCIDTEYSFAHASFDAGVLLDAALPNATAPPALPGATAVRHHRGYFSAPGWSGQILARRLGNAWLAVEGGATLRQRLRVLSHLRASVHV